MPKLDNTHIADRLRERLADLKSDKEVAAREIKALLNKEQLKAFDADGKQICHNIESLWETVKEYLK